MEDSNTESISEDKKIKKNNSWIRQVIINLTLLYMIRLSLLPMLIVGMNVLHKKKSQWKKKSLDTIYETYKGSKQIQIWLQGIIPMDPSDYSLLAFEKVIGFL